MDSTIAIIMDILAILVILVPALYGVYKAVKKAIDEKNWHGLIATAIELIASAEQKFANGTEKKQFVMDMLKESAEKAGVKYDSESLSKTVDDLVALTKKVNTK